ncbi:MAG: hypothetical protein ACFFAD_06670 [Candidatus Hermodarchaeota archaeon]
MAGIESESNYVWVPRAPPTVANNTMINLVNLLMRETSHRVTVLQKCAGPDPEIYVVTRVEWRSPDLSKPALPQLPRLLSLLETLRGTKGVPHEIHLDSTEGIAVYLPTGVRVSQVPSKPKEAVQSLTDLIESSVSHMYSTKREVEAWFWKIARQKGFSPEIVERMANKEIGYKSPSLMWQFHQLLQKYFSLRFRIHTSESCLHLEADY